MPTIADLLSLTGETALVTGASRGIGAAIADALGRAGATVLGTATTEAGAAAITARFREQAIAGRGLVLDASSAESVAMVEKDIASREGSISM